MIYWENFFDSIQIWMKFFVYILYFSLLLHHVTNFDFMDAIGLYQ